MPEDGHEHLVQPQSFRAVAQFLGQLQLLAVELEEDARFAAQHVRVDGFVEKVDGAGFVSLEMPVLVTGAGGHEDQRDVLGPLAAAHELGELESVHLGHLHIQQRKCDVVLQKQIQGLSAAIRTQNFHVVLL